MSDKRDLLQVQWTEGMLLTPQHFQQADLRTAELLRYHAQGLSPFHWGVLSLKPVIRGHSFEVQEIEAIMPDGLIVTYPPPTSEGTRSELPPAPSLDLSPHIAAYMSGRSPEQRLTLYLAVTRLDSGVQAVGGDLARYVDHAGWPVADLNTGGGNPERVPRLYPRLRLIASGESRTNFTSFPIARLVFREKALRFDASFTPPQLRVSAGSGLRGFCGDLATLCSDLVQDLRRWAKDFIDQDIGQDPGDTAQRGPHMLERKLNIHQLVSSLPAFEALLGTQAAHPFALYQALCDLAGRLTLLRSNPLMPPLDDYDHDDAMKNFLEVRRQIVQSIKEGFPQASYDELRFDLENHIFSLPYDARWADRLRTSHRLIVGLRDQPGIDSRTTAQWFEGSLIGSVSRLAEIESMRITGLPRRPIAGLADLVPRRGESLFEIAVDPDLVVSGEPLVVRSPDDPEGHNRPEAIILYLSKRT